MSIGWTHVVHKFNKSDDASLIEQVQLNSPDGEINVHQTIRIF